MRFCFVVFSLFVCLAGFAACTPPNSSPDGSSADASSTDGNQAEPTPEKTGPMKCNGYVALCDRRFNEVVFASSHNSMSSREKKWFAPNHLYGMQKQLEAGIRGMMLDVYKFEGGFYLCHGDCQFGKTKLVEGFTLLRKFLDKHPHETLTLIFESYIPDSDLAQAVKDSDLVKYVFTHKLGEPWPTLRTMMETGKRVVLFTGKGGTPAWLHKQDKHAWENHYAAKNPEDLTCKRRRGDRTQPIWIFNHFLTNPIALKELAEKINHNPFFLKRVQECQKQEKQLPNFLVVDFYSVGNLLDVVNTLNGVK